MWGTGPPSGNGRDSTPIVGNKVTLRELRWEDIADMERWPLYDEPDLQWANFDLKTQGQKEIWYRQELYDPSRRRYAILAGDALVGVLGLRGIDFQRGRATLGIRLSAGEVNKGYGTDAILTVLDHAFNRLRLAQVDLDVAEENHRAQRCYLKCGFHFVRRRQDYRGAVYLDMTISAEEFARRKKDDAGPLSR
ncbi:MAG: GNAT family N-acetyltransferase [Chloroflexota bacterium]